jgi:hypothetical protein
MEIHKPKAVHSFREFLSELGVVVLGIVIALSGEQLIEHMRDSHRAAEARKGIRDEIGMNIVVLQSRNSAQSCIDQRRAMEGLPHPSEALKAEVRLAWQDARLTNWDIKNLNKGLQTRAAGMAIPEQTMPRQQPDSGICFPMSTPRAEALNRLSAGAGYRV